MKKIRKILLVITLIYFSFIKQVYAPTKSANNFLPTLIIAIFLAALITALIILWLISKNRMEKTNEEAREYLVKDSIKIRDIEDTFVDSKTIRYKNK